MLRNDARGRALLLRWVVVPGWLQLTMSAIWIDSVIVRFVAHPLRAVIMVVLVVICSVVILWLVWRCSGQAAGIDIKAELRAAPHFGAKLVVVWRWYRVVQLWWLIWLILAAAATALNTLGVVLTP